MASLEEDDNVLQDFCRFLGAPLLEYILNSQKKDQCIANVPHQRRRCRVTQNKLHLSYVGELLADLEKLSIEKDAEGCGGVPAYLVRSGGAWLLSSLCGPGQKVLH